MPTSAVAVQVAPVGFSNPTVKPIAAFADADATITHARNTHKFQTSHFGDQP